MNKDWIDFLKSNDATINAELAITFPENQQNNEHTITPISHLAILKITGADATQFLQGQLTCNINELTEFNSFFSASCNAKGRTITTLLIYKKNDEYLIILPKELTDKVITKFRMYILRSAVNIQDVTDELCLVGLTTPDPTLLKTLPEKQFDVNQSTTKISLYGQDHRYLMINSVTDASSAWNQLYQSHGVTPVNSSSWKFQDISTGIPWLTQATSEEYIPQMLNIDKLGGISFNKGCYTGQEIIARTHYLGKAKRELFLAECNPTAMLKGNIQIFKNNSEHAIGKVISTESSGKITRMLTVIQNSDDDLHDLILDTPNKDKINLIDFK